MTESKICTCPSGDGSLVHPCPAHPAVEQVGDAAFELFVRKHCGMPAHIAVNWPSSPMMHGRVASPRRPGAAF